MSLFNNFRKSSFEFSEILDISSSLLKQMKALQLIEPRWPGTGRGSLDNYDYANVMQGCIINTLTESGISRSNIKIVVFAFKQFSKSATDNLNPFSPSYLLELTEHDTSKSINTSEERYLENPYRTAKIKISFSTNYCKAGIFFEQKTVSSASFVYLKKEPKLEKVLKSQINKEELCDLEMETLKLEINLNVIHYKANQAIFNRGK